ncbi:MAG TPA: 3'-5' exonuclease, partial [Armatimonadota bacterium]|nr:3'-5' exonuclease [Armatimonadota bacterium]
PQKIIASPQDIFSLTTVALDLETTGLSPEDDRIVEVAAVKWINGEETDSFHSLVNPERRMPKEASEVNGITDAMLADQPLISTVLPQFLEFCQADIVIAHYASFDYDFLLYTCVREKYGHMPFDMVDTCEYARQAFPGHRSYKLRSVKRYLQIKGRQTHRALDDARDCMAVFMRCVQEYPDYMTEFLPAIPTR